MDGNLYSAALVGTCGLLIDDKLNPMLIPGETVMVPQKIVPLWWNLDPTPTLRCGEWAQRIVSTNYKC